MSDLERHEAVADAIDAARFAHPDHPRDRPRPFSEADASDREYASRLAIAAIRALATPAPEARSAGGDEPTIADIDAFCGGYVTAQIAAYKASGCDDSKSEPFGNLVKAGLRAVFAARASSPDAGNGSREGGANPVGGAVIAMPCAWQPIETAPKDGGYVVTNRKRQVAFCDSRNGERTIHNVAGFVEWDWPEPATLWQPLPKPPRQGDRAGLASTHSPQPEPISSPDAERIRAEALEEAKEAVQRCCIRYYPHKSSGLLQHQIDYAREDCVESIRALQSPAPEGE